jgi:hypothetical protein
MSKIIVDLLFAESKKDRFHSMVDGWRIVSTYVSLPTQLKRWLVVQCEDACEWNANPRRSIIEFVEQFVQRLLQQICIEEELRLCRPWDEIRIYRLDRMMIGAEKLGRYGVLPEVCPRLQIFGVVGSSLREGIVCGVCSIAEGAQHPRNIFQWRLLGSTRSKAASGFSFEVEDDVVAV